MKHIFAFTKYMMSHTASANFAEASSCANTAHNNFISLILGAIAVASIIVALIGLITVSLVLDLHAVLLVLVSLLLVVLLIIGKLNMSKRR